MSQLLQTKSDSKIYQDLYFPGKKLSLQTTASLASCYVCGKGLEDGYAVTAKIVRSQTLLYCEKHYSMQKLV